MTTIHFTEGCYTAEFLISESEQPNYSRGRDAAVQAEPQSRHSVGPNHDGRSDAVTNT
jgi:hypothetical protein